MTHDDIQTIIMILGISSFVFWPTIAFTMIDVSEWRRKTPHGLKVYWKYPYEQALLWALTSVLVWLKLAGDIDWSWWWVLSLIWVSGILATASDIEKTAERIEAEKKIEEKRRG